MSAPAAYAGVEPTPVTITVATDRTTLDPEHPTAKITGRVTAQRPGEPEHPLAQRQVQLRGGYLQTPDAVTDDQGYFAATYSSGGAWSPVVAEVAASGEYAGATAATENIETHAAATRVAITADKKKVDRGVPFKLGGLVEWQSSTGWQPLSGATAEVLVMHGCSVEHKRRYPVTGADGRYTITITPVCSASARVLTTSHPSGLYATAESPGYAGLTVRPGVKITFRAQLDPYGKVTIDGSMYPREPANGEYYTGQRIDIQYSHRPNGPWRKHKTVRISGNGFSTTFNVGYSGYWRAKYAGGPKGMPGVSPTRKLWRWGTRMSKIKVSPSRVRLNRTVTASGVLTRYYNLVQRKPSAFKGQNVRIIFRFRGKKTWYHLAWDKTDSKGRFVKKVRAYGDGYYAAVFHGTRDTWATGTPNTPYVDTYSARQQLAAPGQMLPFQPLWDLQQPGGSPDTAAFVPLN